MESMPCSSASAPRQSFATLWPARARSSPAGEDTHEYVCLRQVKGLSTRSVRVACHLASLGQHWSRACRPVLEPRLQLRKHKPVANLFKAEPVWRQRCFRRTVRQHVSRRAECEQLAIDDCAHVDLRPHATVDARPSIYGQLLSVFDASGRSSVLCRCLDLRARDPLQLPDLKLAPELQILALGTVRRACCSITPTDIKSCNILDLRGGTQHNVRFKLALQVCERSLERS